MFLGLLFILPFVSAYLEQTSEIEFVAKNIGIADNCMLYTNETHTVVHYHNGNKIYTGPMSDIYAINNECSLVVYGYPSENKVILWRPQEDTFTTIQPDQPGDILVERFGFSVDVQNQSWVVGAPGIPNSAENNYEGATIGYAFTYIGDELQSCRSLYDTFCYPLGTECKLANFKNTKDYYKFLKGDSRYQHVFKNLDPLVQIKDEEMPRFQKVCITPQQPYYSTGPIDPVRVPYFRAQQFGYAVALSGDIRHMGTSLYVSAPGDTNKFMEDNDGSNYGRVYMWDVNLWDPQDMSLPTISWWEFSIFAPVIPPNMRGSTYRAFGRDIAVSRATLAVSTYPLYENKAEPFIIVYSCKPELHSASHCEESPNRGIAINDLPGNALSYLSNKMLSYTDGKTRWKYIPADVEGDLLPDFQNDFIGKHIGVTGSNVVVPDHHNGKVYRFGSNSRHRETHSYLHNTQFTTNSEHLLTQSENEVTHMWPCPRGSVSGKELCSYNDDKCVERKCIPCELQYYSNDGWLDECDLCPSNYTTYQEGMSECELWVPPIIPGMAWSEARTIMIVVISCSIGVMLLITLCQYTCYKKNGESKKLCCCDKRRKRKFNDTLDV